MRTDAEILARIKQLRPDDFLGFDTQNLIIRLPFHLAKPYLKPEITEKDWNPASRDRDTIISEMLGYMPFAWDKANGKRGTSASRSMSHYKAWVWLACDDLGNLSDYEFYGKDNLVKICNHYGWDSSQWDDGVRENS